MNKHTRATLIILLFCLPACGGNTNNEGDVRENVDDVYVYYDESYRQCNWSYFKELTGATIWPWWYAVDNVDNIKAIFFVYTDRMTVGDIEAVRLSIADAPIYISTVNELPDTLYSPSAYGGSYGLIKEVKSEAKDNRLWAVVLDREDDFESWGVFDTEANTNTYAFIGCDVVMETIAELIYGSVMSF